MRTGAPLTRPLWLPMGAGAGSGQREKELIGFPWLLKIPPISLVILESTRKRSVDSSAFSQDSFCWVVRVLKDQA